MHLVVISQGIPFIHAGQEFFRSKKGVENSYNSPDEINMIHWKPNSQSVRLLKKLLRIRRSFKLYRMPSYGGHASVAKDGDRLVYRLEDNKVVLVHHIKNRKGLERIATHGGTLIFCSRDVLLEDDAVIVDEPGVYILKLSKS
jgi:pullulanase